MPRLSKQDLELAKLELLAGARPYLVADKYGVSRQSMSRLRLSLLGYDAKLNTGGRPPAGRAASKNATDWQRVLCNARASLGMSLNEAGGKIGINGTTLASWEEGRRMPSVENLRAALNFYGYELVILRKVDKSQSERPLALKRAPGEPLFKSPRQDRGS